MLKFINKLLKPLHLRMVKIPAYALAAEAAAAQSTTTSTTTTSTDTSDESNAE